MTAKVIDGKARAAELREQVKGEVAKLKSAHGVTPGLVTVLVGEHAASRVYVNAKIKTTKDAGMESTGHNLPETTTQEELLALIDKLNADPAVHGILIQLPLPSHIDEPTIINAVSPDKDVDGFHYVNAGKLATGQPALVPCTPLGALKLLRAELGSLSGREAVVVGRSNIVGKPMGQLLLRDNATVTMAHSRTKDLAEVCRRADIIVAAVGRPELIKGDWIKPGATIIDVGINRVENGLVGDVDFAAASKVAGAISPVPGGAGPMTIACLLVNTLVAACRINGLPVPKDLGL